MDAAERLILYVVQGIQDEGGYPSRTKVLKILYLIDLECFRRHRRTLTGWRWVFHYYGPYAFEYRGLLERLGLGDLQETEVSLADGRRVYRYATTSDRSLDGVVDTGRDADLIDRIIERWALEDLNLLLDHVYFHTEPMRAVSERGAALAFSTIGPLRPVPQGPPHSLSSEKLADHRQRLRDQVRQRREAAARTRELMEHYWAKNREGVSQIREAPGGWDAGALPDGTLVKISAD